MGKEGSDGCDARGQFELRLDTIKFGYYGYLKFSVVESPRPFHILTPGVDVA
jgi:hypothetical protein